MLRATVVLTCVIYVTFTILIAKECAFLRPVVAMIWRDYQSQILIFSALFLFNTGAAIHGALRRLTLADTGDKLAYLEKQLRGRSSISKELTERMREER